MGQPDNTTASAFDSALARLREVLIALDAADVLRVSVTVIYRNGYVGTHDYQLTSPDEQDGDDAS